MNTERPTVNGPFAAILRAAALRCGVRAQAIKLPRPQDRDTMRARRLCYLAARRLPFRPSFEMIGREYDRERSAVRKIVMTALKIEREDARFARAVDAVLQAGVGVPYLPPELPGSPCVTPDCAGRMVAPPQVPTARRQCPLCERYEPRGMAAREMRRAG